MNDRIAQALTRLFERHRIVFWYDAKHELHDEYEALSLPDVIKLEIENNEYGLKYRILREEPKQKFLLYHDGPQPEYEENWLLDVLLAYGEFRTDQVAIWLSELELGPEFADLVQAHEQFFQAIKRKDALRKYLKPDDTRGMIRQKMLAVCSGSEPRMDSVMEHLLQELADGKDEKIKLISRCELDGFLWEQLTRHYGYQSSEPGIRDFTIELFKSCYAMGTDGALKLTGDALVFFKRWKDSRQFESGFEKLSEECADVLGIEQDLAKRDFRELIELDYFELIDKKVISDLVQGVASRTVSSGDVALWIRQRRQGHWYQKFNHHYNAIDYAAQFISTLSEVDLRMDGLLDGIQKYSRIWFRLDQLYRKFIYHMGISGQAVRSTLEEPIENLYSNNFLLKVNDRFQAYVDSAAIWDASPLPLQKSFFKHWVQPYLRKNTKVCVIISDALRYEIGEELVSLIRQEDRYGAEIDSVLSMLPSYTQLGMAALLPNEEMAITRKDSATVLVDGRSSQGIANRSKILENAVSQRTIACKADELMAMGGDECRNLFREHDVVYIYHNRIDATGDKRESEERVFEAVEETLQDLIRLIKKLAAANASNMLLTSDHGFIYQNHTLDESDFSGIEPDGAEIVFRDRRFVIGTRLKDMPGLRKFIANQVGLAGELEIQIPKSINRLRLKGSGSRYVHGGASLQEVVLPVLSINKKRRSDVTSVEVDILRGASSAITSGQLAVVLYQTGPVTEKIQPRLLRAGIYTEAGDLISDVHELTFDLTSENPRKRELRLRFVLAREADKVNEQEVVLRLEEKHAGTSHYKEYKSLRYMMRRTFTSDFDF